MSVAVAAPHPSALDAAAVAVAAGGNAFDAALAAAGALTVAYPHQCSVGGDLVAMVRPAGSPVRAVLSIGAAAVDVDVAALATQGRMPTVGPQTVTVPGVVAGWAAVHGLGARLSLSELLAPAVALAADGVAISPGLRRALAARRDDILAGLIHGSALVQPALAATLTAIGADWRSFYQAPSLLSGVRDFGSPLSAADFAAHRAEVVEPLTAVADGLTWHAAPPPVQGATFLAVVGSAALIEDSRQARAARDALLGDPRGGPIDVDGLLHPRSGAASASGLKPTGDTVAITAVDDLGNAITLIQSVFHSFGSGLLDPATGVVLHNRGSSFSLDPAHPGRIAPGVRPPHTLCPTIAVSADDVIALGCQGGRNQPWILAQVAAGVRTADDPAELVARPRWILDDAGVIAEPGSASGPLVTLTEGPHDDAGHVQVSRLRAGVLDAGSDPRADGLAVVVDPS